jgi:uncharacterized protein (DUF1501 family)
MNNHEWWSCEDYAKSTTISRRGLLVGSGLALLGLGLRRSALGQIAVRTTRHAADGNTLVVIFLRGGMDGLNAIVPYAEDAYYRARPALGIARPNDGTAKREDRALDLNGFFGAHPSLAPLMPLYQNGQMAFVHAIGSMDESHSHFEAMNAMERGLAASGAGDPSGWLARHLMSSPGNGSAMRAVAIGGTMPDSLRGASTALALESLDDFRLTGDRSFRAALDSLYSTGTDPLTAAGKQTLKAMDALQSMPVADKKSYPDEELAQGLRQVSQLIKSGVGVEVACLEKTGWDTHVAQGSGTGILSSQLSALANALAAFARDMGPRMDRVTVIAQTEFGRRVHENDGFGTDHGHGSVMFLMGGGVKPGVHGKWPGLAPDQLSGPGDLQVTTDYRNVFAEILNKRLGNPQSDKVFPNLQFEAPQFVA